MCECILFIWREMPRKDEIESITHYTSLVKIAGYSIVQKRKSLWEVRFMVILFMASSVSPFRRIIIALCRSGKNCSFCARMR